MSYFAMRIGKPWIPRPFEVLLLFIIDKPNDTSFIECDESGTGRDYTFDLGDVICIRSFFSKFYGKSMLKL